MSPTLSEIEIVGGFGAADDVIEIVGVSGAVDAAVEEDEALKVREGAEDAGESAPARRQKESMRKVEEKIMAYKRVKAYI